MKVLYILNIANRINNFSYTSMMAAKSLGWDYHIAGNWGYKTDEERLEDEKKYGISIYQIDFIRQPYHPKNMLAYNQLLEVAKREDFDVIHCNTPIGGVVGRLIGKKCKVKKVIYQAHGFHFYKGAPLLNWFVYYPVEKWLARYTDALITINQEDYELAQKKFKLRNHGKFYYVPGVGIDLKQYQMVNTDRTALRQSIGVQPNDIMLISMGDLVVCKNYKTAIEAVARANNPNLKYVICGKVPEMEHLQQLSSSLGISNLVIFLGFRSDIKELLKTADIFLFTTLQEGLPRSMMEAMASGLPCIASNIRGNTDLIKDNVGGFLCGATDAQAFTNAIHKLSGDPELRQKMALSNLKTITHFDTDIASKEINKVYKQKFILRNLCGGTALSDFYPLWVQKRLEIGVPLDAFVLIAVGRLDKNKNNKAIIEAMSNTDAHLILCGDGEERGMLEALTHRLGLDGRVLFLGNRTDMAELYQASDCFVMSSFREGLSRSLMEAMVSGLPCVVSKIRGNADLIEDGVNGFVVYSKDIEGYTRVIKKIIESQSLRRTMIAANKKKINHFDVRVVEEQIKNIYEKMSTM